MDAANQVRLREVQLVVATINEDALGIEDCAHSAVTEEGGIFKTSKKVSTHSNQNTRELWRVPDREGIQYARLCGRSKPFFALGCYNPEFCIQASILQA